MDVFVLVIFSTYNRVLDFSIFKDRRLAEKEYNKILKAFNKDKVANEMLLQAGNVDSFLIKTYGDFLKNTKFINNLKIEIKRK